MAQVARNQAPVPGSFIGRLGSLTQLVFAVLLGAVPFVSGVMGGAGSPDILPRGIVLFGLYALPAMIGLLAVRSRRPALLLTAGAASGFGSILAFSGVTLIFLIPTTLLVTAGLRLEAGRFVAGSTALDVGTFGQIGLAVVVLVLIVAAGVSALFTTESACWTTYRTATGVRYEMAPYSTGEMTLPEGAESGGCTNGLLSARGIGLGAMLGLAALGLAAVGSGRENRHRPRSSTRNESADENSGAPIR